MKPAASLAPRLLAGFGTAALLGAVCLVSSRPAHTAGGPVPVTVSNTPLAVTPTDATVQQPFTANVVITIPNGSDEGTDNGGTIGAQAIPVPAGKRLIVQTVSQYRVSATAAGSTVQIFVNSSLNGTYSAYSLSPAPGTSASYSGSTQALTFQADGGSALVVNAFRNTTVGAESDVVTVSGYLVNVP